VRSAAMLAEGARRRLTRFSTMVSQAALFWLQHHDGQLLARFERGFSDDPSVHGTRGECPREIIDRIVAAYRLAKEDQRSAPPEYAVGPMWESMVRRNFGDVLSALEHDDMEGLAAILAGFHRNKCSLWTGGSYEDLIAWQRSRLYKYQFINTWLRYEVVFEEIAGEDAKLTYSQVGRPVGLETNGGIIPLEAIRYHYWQKKISGLLEGIKRPVVCEIGGGLGGQAFKVLQEHDGPLVYVIFDIPEVLLISSYFLLRSLPGLRVLLHGEDRLDAEAHGCYDLILMPNFRVAALADESIDLFFNSCSFSEMLRRTAEAYLHVIERSCRGYFLHVNHTARFQWEADGVEYSNLPADELVPDPERFELVDKTPRPFGRIEDESFLRRYGAHHFVFLYRRVGNSPLKGGSR